MLPIDRLTNSLEEVATGMVFDAEIHGLQKADLRNISDTNGWNFDWHKEYVIAGRKIFKLLLPNDVVIQGLIAIEDMQNHLYLPLIETAPHNFGNKKKYRGVAKSLTAFACKRSFEFGYAGEVSFVAKTKLIEHYKRELGAVVLTGQRMLIYGENAHKLVSLYFKDFTE